MAGSGKARENGLLAKLTRALAPSDEPRRERPSELVYAIGEKPPLGSVLVLSAQHALMALMLMVYNVIAIQQLGLSPEAVTASLASTVFILGLATVLQTLRTALSSGHLLVHAPNPIAISTYISVTLLFGLGATAVAIVIASIVVILLAGVIPKARRLFPPEVSGVVVVMLGLSLIAPGVSRATHVSEAGALDGVAVLVTALTLASIVAVSIWAPRRIKIFALAVGLVVGFAANALLPATPQPMVSATDALFAVPLLSLELPRYEFVLMAVVPLVIVEIINAVDGVGGALTSDKMNDANWRRADMAMVGRALRTLGISNVLCGLTGTLTTTLSSANIGLMYATGVTARVVGTATGVLLMALAFFPPAISLLANAPEPVLGAILLYTGGYMIASGMELILSRLLNDRRTVMIGLSIAAGASVMLMPQLTLQAPAWSQSLVASGITVGTLTAVILNLVFRIGVKQQASTPIEPGDAAHQAWRFLQDQGAAWGARRQVMARAGTAVGEAIEALRSSGLVRSEEAGAAGEGAMTLRASFDEYLVVCEIVYDGRALPIAPLDDAAPLDLDRLLDDEDDASLDRALNQASSAIVRKLADSVRAEDLKGGRARLQLAFEH